VDQGSQRSFDHPVTGNYSFGFSKGKKKTLKGFGECVCFRPSREDVGNDYTSLIAKGG